MGPPVAMQGSISGNSTKGRRTAAVIDLKKHQELWEDIEAVIVSQTRPHEKRSPFEKVKAGLISVHPRGSEGLTGITVKTR